MTHAVHFVSTVNEFKLWLAEAKPGERAEYHRGFLFEDTEPAVTSLDQEAMEEAQKTAACARYAQNVGHIELIQRKHGAFNYSYLAIAKASKKPIDYPNHKNKCASLGVAKISSMEKVCDLVIRHSGVNERAFKSGSHIKAIAQPRQLAMFLIVKRDIASITETGKFLNREHGSVNYAIKRIVERLETDADLRALHDSIVAQLDSGTG